MSKIIDSSTKSQQNLSLQDPKKSIADENIVKQFQMLQNTVGNQKVLELMRMGILPSSMPKTTQSELNQSQENKTNAEEQLINKDRVDLMPKIMNELGRKKNKLDELKAQKPGIPVFANVSIELNYVTIPGNKPINLYHVTDLVNVDFSFKEINDKKKPVVKNRGFTIPVTFSFLFDKNEIKEDAAKAPAKSEKNKEKDEVKNDKENDSKNKNKPDDSNKNKNKQ